MSRALVAGAAAPTTLRLAQSRKQKAASIAAGVPAPKRQRTARLDPVVAAAGQKFVNWAVESPLRPDVIEPAAPTSPVLVAFHVPACQLAFGEHLRVVGSCAQLGGWDPAAAPALEWTEGDNWTASVALPPGQHAFKLVLMRQHGSPYWELGPDRSLELPAVTAKCGGRGTSRAVAGAAVPLSVTCSWGNTAAMTVNPDPAQQAAAAEAAAPQVAGLLVQQGQTEDGDASGMVIDVAQAHRDASLALVGHNIGALLAAEQQQLEAQQAQHAQQQHAVAEAVAAFADAAAAVHDAEAMVHDAVDSWDAEGTSEIAAARAPASVDGPSAIAAEAAAMLPAAAEPAFPAAALPPATAVLPMAAPHPADAVSSSSGEQLFHFGGGSEEPSALQMARQQLVGRLPQEAAAGLEAALRSMNGAPGSRRQRAVLASLALHGPAVPAEQLYGVGSHERHPLAAHRDSPAQAAVAEKEEATEEELASLTAQLDQRLALAGAANHTGGVGGASTSRAVPAVRKNIAIGKPDNPVLRGSFPGAAAYLAAQSVVTVGSLLWSAGRAAMPKAGRRVADAAMALACTAAAAVALS